MDNTFIIEDKRKPEQRVIQKYDRPLFKSMVSGESEKLIYQKL